MKFEALVAVPTMIAIVVEMLPSSSFLKMEGAHVCHHILKTAFLTILSPLSVCFPALTFLFYSQGKKESPEMTTDRTIGLFLFIFIVLENDSNNDSL